MLQRIASVTLSHPARKPRVGDRLVLLSKRPVEIRRIVGSLNPTAVMKYIDAGARNNEEIELPLSFVIRHEIPA